jgi:hypothetical protein
VAIELTAHDALAAHAEAEYGIIARFATRNRFAMR